MTVASPSTRAPARASGSTTSTSSVLSQTQYPDRFTYRPCLSEETEADCGDDAAAYGFGMVTDVIAADHATLAGATGYLCGPPPMVEAALKTLMGKRLFPRDIHREDFFNEGDKATGGVRSPLIKR